MSESRSEALNTRRHAFWRISSHRRQAFVHECATLFVVYGSTCTSRVSLGWVCCKSARHWLTAAAQKLYTDNGWVRHRPRRRRPRQLLCFRCPTPLSDTAVHYPRRPAQYIIGDKPPEASNVPLIRLSFFGQKLLEMSAEM